MALVLVQQLMSPSASPFALVFLLVPSCAALWLPQGALISMALVLVQQPESRVAPFRKRVDKFYADKHEEVRVGWLRAQGLGYESP